MYVSKIDELVTRFISAKSEGADSEQLNTIAEELQKYNQRSYGEQTSFVLRRLKVSDFEMEKWTRLRSYVAPDKNVKLFDCAFGSGRDLFIAQKLGYDVYGCELSEFLYSDFLACTNFEHAKLVNADFRSLPYPDDTFDVVRHNASFLHMPVIGKGYTVHQCLEESCRILKEGGYLYVYTKEGVGFVTIDTGDGLGSRSFQLYDERLLTEILLDCGFAVKSINHYLRERNGTIIKWIEAFAQKESK